MFAWLSKLFGKERNVVNEQQLSSLISGLHRAASASLDVAGEQHSRLIEQFFDPLENGTMKPKMVRLEIDEERYMSVPLISLVPPISIKLENLRMRFSVKLTQETFEALKNGRNLDTDFVKIKMPPHSYTNGQRKDFVDIILELRAGDPPESVRHLLDTYSKSVSIQTREKDTYLPPTDYAKNPAYQAFLKTHRQRQTGKKRASATHEVAKGWLNKLLGQASRQ